MQLKSETQQEVSLNLPIDDSEYSEHKFVGWRCNKDGVIYYIDTEETLLEWALFADVDTIVLTAEWEKLPNVSVEYVNEFASTEREVIQQLSVKDLTFQVTIPNTQQEKMNYKFNGWLCSADNKSYYPGETTTDFEWDKYGNEIITFMAQWEELPKVSIQYLNEDEEFRKDSIQQSYESISSFLINVVEEVPEKECYKFTGWLCSADNKVYQAKSVIEGLKWEEYKGGTITFTAQWEELPKVDIKYIYQNAFLITQRIYLEH